MAHSSERLGATLFDSIQNTLVAAAEIGGNRLLALDETALQRCTELQGYCIAIDITDLDFQLYCHPGSWGLRLARSAPAARGRCQYQRTPDGAGQSRFAGRQAVDLDSRTRQFSRQRRARAKDAGDPRRSRHRLGRSIGATQRRRARVSSCTSAHASSVNGCSKAPNRYCRPAASTCAKKRASARPRSSSSSFRRN